MDLLTSIHGDLDYKNLIQTDENCLMFKIEDTSLKEIIGEKYLEYCNKSLIKSFTYKEFVNFILYNKSFYHSKKS